MIFLKRLSTLLMLQVAMTGAGLAQDTATDPAPQAAAEATGSATDISAPKKVFVIPIRADIDASIIYIIRRGVKEALENDADALILHMDTYGGQVKITQDITDILRKFEPQDQTYTYIDTKAISAGAFISSATRYIYMAPGSVIGAATPVMMAPGGGAQEMGESYEEKIQSALKALVRANAELNGHNPVVFDAMIDRDQGLEVGGETVVPAGKVLTLTSMEAEKVYGSDTKPLLSAGTVDSLDDLITQIGGSPETAVKIEATGAEQIAKFIVSISPILIAGALLLGYIEFKTPGFGLFGSVGAVLAMLFFFGHYVAGLSGNEYIIFLFIGVILIAIEIFLIPGTLVAGMTGLALVTGSLIFAMADVYPNEGFLPSASALQGPLLTFGQAMILVIAGVYASIYFLPKSRLFQHLVLDNTLASQQYPAAGQTAQSARSEIGMEAMTITPLHPGGKIEVDGKPLDAFTEGGYIAQDSTVKIIDFRGSQALVEKI
jgi:membrane-bound serine protease (ClpP class)